MNIDVLRLFDQLASDEQRSLTELFAARHREMEQVGNTLIDTIRQLKLRGWNTHLAIWGPCLFLNTIAYDLSVTLYDLAYEREDWKRRLVARNLATLMYECAEDLPAVFGRDFRTATITLGVPEPVRQTLQSKHKAISGFWTEHSKSLKQIRTVCGAHRDHNVLLVHETIGAIDLLEMLRVATELGRILNELGAASQTLITFTSNVKPPEL